MKSRILIVLLFALSSCGSPEYEKAIADWLQTDENGTWTDPSLPPTICTFSHNPPEA